jgi:hypothetical protein
MKTHALVAVLCLGMTSLAAAQSRPTDSLERSFAAGGRVRLDLSAGDYRVSGSPDDRVHVEWSIRDPSKMKRVHVDARVTGAEAVVRVEGPDNSDLRVHVRVPARSDLVVRMTAGDLKVEGIQGDKDVASHAGDLDIEMGPIADLRRVEAAVWAGDLQAAPLQISKGGLFRSFKWDGKGRYQVQAHLKAGDLKLH